MRERTQASAAKCRETFHTIEFIIMFPAPLDSRIQEFGPWLHIIEFIASYTVYVAIAQLRLSDIIKTVSLKYRFHSFKYRFIMFILANI